MKNIIRHTKFNSNPYGDGGDKRSAQIKEILESHGILFEDVSFQLPKNSSKSALIKLTFRAMVFIFKIFKVNEIVRFNKLKDVIKNFALRIPVLYDSYRNSETLLIWESTVDGNYAYPYLFKATNNPIIALPHNLESLVPTQFDVLTGKNSPHWFEHELKRLAMCDAVFTISREEHWLLKLYGLNSFYLPYYPPRDAEKLFLEIREARKMRPENRDTRKILLIGTAHNPPTYQGMLDVITLFNQHLPNIELHIGGYGTEKLSSKVLPESKVILHGSLSNEQLSYLLIQTDAVLIYQQATTGALTRIPELLIAGIPVIVNPEAARSFYDVDGITLYTNSTELIQVITEFEVSIPALYKKPDCQVENFVLQIKSVLTESDSENNS